MCLRDWFTNWITSLSRTQPGVDGQRSRAMLNPKEMGVRKINDSLYDFCSCEPGQENLVVIFFHSLELDDSADPKETYLRTWTFEDNPQKCWPSTMFREDPYLRNKNVVIRAFATCYDASKYKTSTEGRMEIFLIAENYVQIVIDRVMSEVQQPSNQRIPIILVAHGFGGIVVQELIDHAFKEARRHDGGKAKKFLTNLDGIFFYSTPHGSLKEDVYNQIFSRNGELAEPGKMLSQLNEKLIRSREKFNDIRNTIRRKYRNQNEIMIMSRFEDSETTLGGWAGKIVEEAAARLPTEVTFIGGDHFTICKPVTGEEGFTQGRYEYLRSFIVDVYSGTAQ